MSRLCHGPGRYARCTVLRIYKRTLAGWCHRGGGVASWSSIVRRSDGAAKVSDPAALPDPRRAQGRRHPLPVVLAIAAAAVLCGVRGYEAIAAWAPDLGQAAGARFRCRYRSGRYEVPSRTRIRDVLTRVDPDAPVSRRASIWRSP